MKPEGVTLLELMVTLTIVLILASVAMPLTKVTTKRTQEIQLRQQLRVIRAAIDVFKMEWNRDGNILVGPVCVKNQLSCKEAASPYGYPKSMDVLLGVKLTAQDATVKGVNIRRYLRTLPVDPMTGKADWLLRCYKDDPKSSSWCGEDVYDVMTQSEATALDGTKYRDW